MPVPLIVGGAIAATATCAALQDCDDEYDDQASTGNMMLPPNSKPQQDGNDDDDDDVEEGILRKHPSENHHRPYSSSVSSLSSPAMMANNNNDNKRRLRNQRSSSVTFGPPASSSSMLPDKSLMDDQNDTSMSDVAGQNIEDSLGVLQLSAAIETKPSSVRSVIPKARSRKGAIQLVRSVSRDASSMYDESEKADGFVNGNFLAGKVLDIAVPQGTWVLAHHKTLLAVGLLDGSGVALYDTRSYTLVYTIDRDDAVGALTWLALDDDVSLLAVGGLDGSVALYQIKPQMLEIQGVDLVHSFTVSSQVRTMAMSFYGSLETNILLIVGERHGYLTISSYRPEGLVHTHTEQICRHSSGVLALAIKDALLVTATKDGDVMVRRIQYRALPGSFTVGHPLWKTRRSGPVRAVTFSRDGNRMLFGGYDMRVAIVDTTLFAIVRELKLDGTVNALELDYHERYLGIGTRVKSFVVYDTSTWTQIKVLNTPEWVTSVSWGSARAEGTNMVSFRSETSCVSVVDLTPTHSIMDEIKLYSQSDSNCFVAWSPDGRFLLRTKGNQLIVVDPIQGFEEVAAKKLPCDPLKCIAFCPAPDKQDHFAVVALSGHLTVFKLVVSGYHCDLEEVASLLLNDSLWVVAWSQDGSKLVAGGKGKKLHVVDAIKYKQKIDPVEVEGRVADVKFMPNSVFQQQQQEQKVRQWSSFAVATATGTVATTFGTTEKSLQPTLRVLRPRTVRCLCYHPSLPQLVIGDGMNLISIVDLFEEDTLTEFAVDGRVNVVEFSPSGDILVVGSDNGLFTLHETQSFKVIQEIHVDGFALTASFSKTGRYLALGASNDDYMVVRLGPFVATEFLPLSTSGIENLPHWALLQGLYRSGEGPSLIQRFMLDGSHESLRNAATILQEYPNAMHAFDRRTGSQCFQTAVDLKRPNLLKLVMTTVVNGSLDRENQGRDTILTTTLPDVGHQTLQDMVMNHPPQFTVEILSETTFVKVPFTEPKEVLMTSVQDCGSSSYTDPWDGKKPTRGLKRQKNHTQIEVDDRTGLAYRTPAVLPLTGLGTMKFLSALINECPPTVFDNDAMGLVLRVMWRDYTRKYFLIDIIVFLVYFLLWTFFVDWTAKTTASPASRLTITESIISFVMMILNTLFAIKELIQSRFGSQREYFTSLWNIVDLLSIVLVYAYVVATVIRGGVGHGEVPLAVITTLLLTAKLLSYLRGFDSTGWLISVLIQNFRDVRGFIVVLLTILVGFTVSFRLIFGDVPGECIVQLEEGGFGEDCGVDPFSSLSRSFLSTFELTVVGSYDPGVFDESQYTTLAILTFIAAVICVLVVALNALIAVLSDSYARVQENATANRRKERAELIVEYLSILPPQRRKHIEENTVYFHALLEADEDGDLLVNKDDWQGGLNALRRDLVEMNERGQELNQQVLNEFKSEMDNELATLRREVMAALSDLAADVKEIKSLQTEGGVTLNGRQVARAVKAVKSIGRVGRNRLGFGRSDE